MRKPLCVIAGLAALTASAGVFAQTQTVIYVSPTGSDANDGTSPDKPFATPERAETEIGKRGSGTVFLMDGVYKRTTTLMIQKGASQKWTAHQGAVPIFDGGGQVPDGIRIKAGNVTIEGLTIRNFANNGISAFDSPNVTISNNRISNIASAGWGQAGILIIGNSPHHTISGNNISKTGYAAIEVYGEPGANTSGTVILDNIISDSCGIKDDCGAIYVSGRTRKSDGAIIKGNEIRNYGAPSLKKTFGIYLDDFASNMSIIGNTISGEGSNPILLHGGSGNLITENTIILSNGREALYYDAQVGAQASDMAGNRFDRNIVRGARDLVDLVKMSAAGKKPPSIRDNRVSQ